ncbi:membrane protein insertion efficiency factor YidD [Candidatus Collierbacteria bacterium]|nr:membrane protein insertion efficiency factor YidD [Candidatus Collierbacteria bacterium]
MKKLNPLLRFYQSLLSPLHHALGRTLFGASFACRFTPTCSEYFKQAVTKYGIIRGAVMGLARLSRCQPFSQHPPYDPLP